MPNKQQREQNRANYQDLMRKVGFTSPCSNCLKVLRHGQGHYVPPSLGEDGFYICDRPAA